MTEGTRHMGEPSPEMRKLLAAARELGITIEWLEIAHELGERHSVRQHLFFPISTYRVSVEAHLLNEYGQMRYKQFTETADTADACVERMCARLATPTVRKG